MGKERDLLPSWVQDIKIVNGQDHLSLQSISISFYGGLLPGITNLTQRARYFSIYPWILSNYIKRVGIIDKDVWMVFLRKAEFLYALMASSDTNEFNIAGSRKAKEVLAKSKDNIDFATYAEYGSKQSYWKLSLGAYGQYFISSLRHLKIIFTDDSNQMDYLEKNGKILVKIMEDEIPCNITKEYFDCVEKGSVTKAQLEELCKVLSPLNLKADSCEAEKLRKIFLDELIDKNDSNRIDTLRLVLNIMNNFPNYKEYDLNVNDIRFTLLLNRYYNGKKLNLNSYQPIISLWRAFMIGELTHYTMEVFFRVLLDKTNELDGIELQKLFDLLFKDFTNLKGFTKIVSKSLIKQSTFIDFTKLIADKFSASSNVWNEDKNNVYCIYLNTETAIKDKDSNTAFFNAFLLLSKLFNEYYQDSDLERVYKANGLLGAKFEEYNAYTILNDNVLRSQISVEEGLRYIFRKLIINRHTRVALDKLRVERISTFKFELRGSEIYYLNEVIPTLTSPRLGVALNFIRDLGLFSRENSKITSIGKSYL